MKRTALPVVSIAKRDRSSEEKTLPSRRVVVTWTAEKIKPFSKTTQKCMAAALKAAASKALKDLKTAAVLQANVNHAASVLGFPSGRRKVSRLSKLFATKKPAKK